MKFLLVLLFTTISSVLIAQAIPIVEGIVNPSGLYKDADTIYFTSFTQGTINSKVLSESGTSFTTLAFGFDSPFGLHKKDNFLYVGHSNGITRLDLSKDPVEIEEVINNDISGIEIVEPYIYYSVWGFVDQVWRVNLEKDNNIEIVASDFESPTGVEYWNNTLFVADALGDIIYSIDLSTGLFEKEIFIEATAPNHLFVQEDTLYFGQFSEGKINKVDLTSSSIDIIEMYNSNFEVTGISVSGGKIYFSEYDAFIINEYCPEIISAINNFEYQEISVFPNPATAEITINNSISNGAYILLDLEGRIIEKGKLKENRLNIERLISSSYILYLVDENKFARFIKI